MLQLTSVVVLVQDDGSCPDSPSSNPANWFLARKMEFLLFKKLRMDNLAVDTMVREMGLWFKARLCCFLLVCPKYCNKASHHQMMLTKLT